MDSERLTLRDTVTADVKSPVKSSETRDGRFCAECSAQLVIHGLGTRKGAQLLVQRGRTAKNSLPRSSSRRARTVVRLRKV